MGIAIAAIRSLSAGVCGCTRGQTMSDFDLPLHHEFVIRKGERLLLSQSRMCPCGTTPDANRARITCSLCQGLGVQYAAPVKIVGIVTGIHREKSLLESGIAQPGDLVLGLSPFSPVTLSDYDLIEFTWPEGQPFQGELVTRSADGPTDILAYKVAQMQACLSVDPETDAVTQYQEGVNFTVSGRELTWIADQPQPAADSIYSVKYMARYSWIVFISPQDRRERGVNLGAKAILRLRHLTVGR